VAKHGTLRASDADREQIVDRLRKASAEGRLAAHELEHRVTTALKARTYGELDATVADLPADRRTGRRSGPHWAVSTVRAHPALLVVAIPVAMLVVAAVVAITVLWAVVMMLVLLLGHRGHGRHMRGGPWGYAAGRGFGPPGRTGGRPRRYSPYRP
jgi:Flp pilus assembly protein TadB